MPPFRSDIQTLHQIRLLPPSLPSLDADHPTPPLDIENWQVLPSNPNSNPDSAKLLPLTSSRSSTLASLPPGASPSHILNPQPLSLDAPLPVSDDDTVVYALREGFIGEEKKERGGFWSWATGDRGSHRREAHNKEDGEQDLTRMIGYLVANLAVNSEDWEAILYVCKLASATEANAKEAVKALRREFKYGDAPIQLSAARLWAIMLRNSSALFVRECAKSKFLDTLDDVLTSQRTSPVVRERLLDVLAAAAYAASSGTLKYETGFCSLWKKVKPAGKPDEGVPFDYDDAIFSPSPSRRSAVTPFPPGYQPPTESAPALDAQPLAPQPQPLQPQSQTPQQPNRPKREAPNHGQLQRVIPPEEDMRRLFQESRIANGNAKLLTEALASTSPEDPREKDVIKARGDNSSSFFGDGSHIGCSSSSSDAIGPSTNHENPQLRPYPSYTTLQSNGSLGNASFMTSTAPSYGSFSDPEVRNNIAEIHHDDTFAEATRGITNGSDLPLVGSVELLDRSERSNGNGARMFDNSDEPLKHPDVQCFICQQDIVGSLFHCVDCTTIDVDICLNCETAGLPGDLDASEGGHNSSHIMLMISMPLTKRKAQDVSRHAHGLDLSGVSPLTRSSPGRVSSISAGTVSYANEGGTKTGEDYVHLEVCKSCDEPIVGIRYQCLNCPSTSNSFNLCSDCEIKSYKVHNPMHVFIKIPRRVDYPRPLESEVSIIPILYKSPAGPLPGSSAAEISWDPAAYLRDLTHKFALCDMHVVRIVGKWYRCAFCAKDLCADCEELDTHDNTHVFLVFKAPVDMAKFRVFADLDNPNGSPPALPGAIYHP